MKAEFCLCLCLCICLSGYTPCQAQKRMIKGGLFATPGVENLGIRGGAGTDVAVLFHTNKRHLIGFGTDYCYWSACNYPIHIPNNLMHDENISTRMRMVSLSMVNCFDLTPASRTKLFFVNKAGFRNTKYKANHTGSALVFFNSSEILQNVTTTGLLGEFSLSLYIPFRKAEFSRVGLELKTGVVTGSKVKYIPGEQVYHNGNTFAGIREETGSLTFWQNAFAVVWRY